MLCFIKEKNIFGQFCKNIYTIKYQKCGFSHIHLLIFLNSADKFSEASHINKVIYTKLSTIKVNSTSKLRKIVTSVMLYGLCEEINSYSPSISNVQNSLIKCIKRYLCNFFEKTSIQKNGYLLYRQRNNSSTHKISYLQDLNWNFIIDNC